MTNETKNNIVVEIGAPLVLPSKGDIIIGLEEVGYSVTVTEIDMTQYVSRAEVEGMLSSLQTVIDAPPDGEYERGHGDGMDTACREFRSLLDEAQERNEMRCPWCGEGVAIAKTVSIPQDHNPIRYRWYCDNVQCVALGPHCCTEAEAVESLKGERK